MFFSSEPVSTSLSFILHSKLANKFYVRPFSYSNNGTLFDLNANKHYGNKLDRLKSKSTIFIDQNKDIHY